MGDAIIDQSELESSARSLNQHSWEPKPTAERSSTPLLQRQDQGNANKRKKTSNAGLSSDKKSGGSRRVNNGTSYSAIVDPEDEKRNLFVTRTVFGEIRNCQRLGWVEWLFVAVAALTLLGILGISVERFVYIHRTFENLTLNNSGGVMLSCSHWSCVNDFIFGLIIVVNWLFCLYYCFDGLLRERPFEIIGYALTIFMIFAFIIIEYFVEKDDQDVFRLVRLVLAFVLGPLNIVLPLVVQYRMGYLVLNTIGSNQLLTRAYHIRSLFLTIQTFNIQILANILVMSWVKDGHFTGIGEKVILPLLLVYMFFISYLGWVAALWELKLLAFVWNFLSVPSLGYYIFKIVNVGVHWSHYEEVYTDVDTDGSTHTHFIYIAIIVLLACVLGLVASAIKSILMILVQMNFNKGLRDRIPPPYCPDCCERTES